MKTFVRTILVILVCLVSLSTSVKAQTGFVVPVGGIAIIGFNFDDPDEFSFVCLTEIPVGIEIRFTDKGWTSNNKFYEYESILSWYTPGGCSLGQIVKIIPGETVHMNNTSGEPFNLSNSGDQIIVYQQLLDGPHFIFALNSEGYNWQSTATNANTSAIHSGLDTANSIALDELDNAIYIGPKSFDSTTEALAAIVNMANWSGSDSTRQIMSSGSFSFTTTAVHLSEFSAETGEEFAPRWVLVVLVIVPVALMVLKRPKKDCCK